MLLPQSGPVSPDPEAQAAGDATPEDVTPDVGGEETQDTQQPAAALPQYLTADDLGRLGFVPANVVQSRIDKAVSAAVKQVVRQLGGTPEDRFLATAQKHGIQIPDGPQRQAFFADTRRQALLATDAPDEGEGEDATQGQTPADQTTAARMDYWNTFAYEAGLRAGDPELAGLDLGRMTEVQAAQAILAAGQKASARRAAPKPAAPVQQRRKPSPTGAAAVFPTGSSGSKVKDHPTNEDAQRDFFGG